MCKRHGAKEKDEENSRSGDSSDSDSSRNGSGEKGAVKTCKRNNCTNRALKGGVCFRHGAQESMKKANEEGAGALSTCCHEGCNNEADHEDGVACVEHGDLYRDAIVL